MQKFPSPKFPQPRPVINLRFVSLTTSISSAYAATSSIIRCWASCIAQRSASHGERRASAYDIADIPELIGQLRSEGCEIGVHGIDAWHSAEKGREELNRVAAVTGQPEMGIRMHWLLHDTSTCSVLEQAGY